MLVMTVRWLREDKKQYGRKDLRKTGGLNY